MKAVISFKQWILVAFLAASFVPSLGLAQSSFDPCFSNGVVKSSVVIEITTAATTSLVAPVTNASIYICGFSLTISQVVTTANTFRLVYGTGATCGTETVNLTGTYGSGGITAGIPLSINFTTGSAAMTTPVSQRLCATTTVGASANFQGVLTYVQR